MRIAFLILLTGIPILAFSQFIAYNDTLELKWCHFKRQYTDTSKVAAVIACGIEKEIVEEKLDYMVIKVFAEMNTESSWVKPDEMTNELLQHELGHFLILEILVRKLRQVLLNRKLSYYNEKMIIQNLIKKCMDAYSEISDIYDKETEYHNNIIMQEKWNKLLRQELANIQKYKNSEIRIPMTLYDPEIQVEFPDYRTFFKITH